MFDFFPLHTNKEQGTKRSPRSCELAAVPAGSAPCYLRWLIAPLFILGIFAMTIESADAKRFGGGRSFGSKPSYSTGYKKPAPQKESAGKQQTATQNRQTQTGNSAPHARPGFGGMIGGLLMGGLIGSLLFGGGFGGGVGLLELILLGAVGYMIFKVIRSRRTAAAGGTAGGNRYAYAGNQTTGASTTDMDDGWASLRSAPVRNENPAQASAPNVPNDFDEAEFLTGAKTLFARLQDSWDKRDLNDIRSFTSPEFMSQIERQAAEDSAPGRTDVLMVEARVLEIQKEGSETVVTVLYDALLREDRNASQPDQVREVWHLRRDEAATRPEWVLEGIQQLEI